MREQECLFLGAVFTMLTFNCYHMLALAEHADHAAIGQGTGSGEGCFRECRRERHLHGELVAEQCVPSITKD